MLSDSNGFKKEDVIHAAVITTQKVVNILGRDLPDYFSKYKVNLINIAPAESYGPEAITLILSGTEKNIKSCLDQIKTICTSKKLGIETAPIKSLPPALKGYLSDMENQERYNKIFSFCLNDYLKHCKENGLKPHPEVIEDLN